MPLETTWHWLQKVPKSAPQTIFDKFSVFRRILVQVKFLLFLTETAVRIFSNELCLLWKGDQFLWKKKMPLLETIWYWLQKVAKSEAWTIFDKFQFLDEF